MQVSCTHWGSPLHRTSARATCQHHPHPPSRRQPCPSHVRTRWRPPRTSARVSGGYEHVSVQAGVCDTSVRTLQWPHHGAKLSSNTSSVSARHPVRGAPDPGGTETHNSTRAGLPCPITLSKLSWSRSMTFDARAPPREVTAARREKVNFMALSPRSMKVGGDGRRGRLRETWSFRCS